MWNSTRTYTLSEDVIDVYETLLFRGHSKISCELQSLNPDPARGWSRPQGFLGGGFLTCLALSVGLYWNHMNCLSLSEPSTWALALFGISSFLWCIASRGKWHYATYQTIHNLPMMRVWSKPKDLEQFEEFVNAISASIRNAKKKAEQVASPNR